MQIDFPFQIDSLGRTAPTDEEKSRPYLWRFWRHVPRRGQIAIFDHSWYGRVLVERVEKLVKKKVWQRSYEQINEFERWLADEPVRAWPEPWTVKARRWTSRHRMLASSAAACDWPRMPFHR